MSNASLLLADQPAAVLAGSRVPRGLACEPSLRVAAATLAHAAGHELSATRVVGALGKEDAASFQALVAHVAADYALEAEVHVRPASFAVRFSR